MRNPRWQHDESCHLVCDPGELDQLHQFAAGIGLQRRWFQNKPNSTPHYDLTKGKRIQAVAAGATEIDRHGIVAVMKAWREHRKPEPELTLV